jgi:hypothetical protein
MFINRLFTVFLCFSVLLFTLPDTLHAKDRTSSGTLTNAKGKTVKYQGVKTGNLKEGRTRNQTFTGVNGKSRTRTVQDQYNKETSTGTKTITRGDYSRTMTGKRTGKGAWNGTYQTNNGKSGTYNTTTTKNDDGSYTRNNSWTNQDGETKSSSTTGTYDKATKTLNTTTTGPDGKTHSGAVTYTPNQ